MEIKKEDLILEPRQKYDYEPSCRTFYDTIIIGAGIVGFSAAMYAARLGLKTLIIGSSYGGNIILTDVIENWPGIVSVSGIKLGKLVENHAKDYPVNILRSKVEKISIHRKAKGRHFLVETNHKDHKKFYGKTIIYATGTEIRKLGVPGEREFNGRGVSYCALCDGPLFKGKEVGVIGGSDSAIKEAILLTKYAKKVYVIYRGDKIHPEPVNMKKINALIKEGKIEILNNRNVKEILGEKGKLMNQISLDKPYKGKNNLELGGLFVYIGHLPLSNLAKEIKVRLNNKKEVKINRRGETNIKGFFAAGDVVDTPYKQAITGSAEGVSAAYSAYEYINKGEFVLPSNEMNSC